MTARQQLLLAARLIQRRGWYQRTPAFFAGRVCIMDAITEIGIGPESKAALLLDEVTGINSKDDQLGVRLVAFNDYHCDTADDAIAALEIAADLAA